MHALRQDILSPSGVEFVTWSKLTPSTIKPKPDSQKGLTLFNLVVARSNLLRIFEVREVPTLRSSHLDDERERRGNVRKGTEPVEGEVEMDEQGEGYVNMGAVKVIWIAHSCPLHRAIQLLCPPSEPKTSSELTLIALLFVIFSQPHPMGRLAQLFSAFTLCEIIVFMELSPDWRVCASCLRWKMKWTDSWSHSRMQRSA